MKKTILFIYLLLNFGISFSQISAFQRIAVPATEFELSTTNISKVVPSFCLDFNRASPKIKATNFDFIHLDEKCVIIGNALPITLQEAINKKFIDLEVDGYKSVKFKYLQNSNETIKISILKNVVIGDVKNDTKNLMSYAGLKHTTDPIEQEKIQQALWDRQKLINLNYLKEEDINNETTFKEAIVKFQKDNMLSVNGIIGWNTRLALDKILYENNSIKKFLPEEDNRLKLSDAIKKFQKTYLLVETGEVDDATEDKLFALEDINNSINSNYNGIFLDDYSEKIIYISEDDFTHVISADGEEYKYLKLTKKLTNNGFVISESHNLTKSDISLFDIKYDNAVSNLSTNQIEIIHAGAFQDNKIRFQIGKTEQDIVVSENIPNFESEILNKIFEKIENQSKTNNIIIARDNFVRNVANNNSASFLISNDFKSFKSERINPQYIIEKLRVKFPDKNFYLGGDIEKDISSINSMPKVNFTSDIVAFTAPKSLEVEYDLLSNDNVKKTFIQKNITVIDLDDQVRTHNEVGSNVILITGNKDENFENYLNKLLLTVDVKDKVIVTFSCFKEGNDFTNSFLIKTFKANSIIYFPTKIHPDATKKVLLKFSEMISNNPSGKTVRELMEKSIKEAFDAETIEFLKTEIGKLKQFIQQTSFNYQQEQSCIINKS